MGSVFINYGVKAGGGPPFLKRTRTASAQAQQRTRTGQSTSQLQQRTRACVYSGCYLYWCGYWCSDFETFDDQTNTSAWESCNIGGEVTICEPNPAGWPDWYCYRYNVGRNVTWAGWSGWSNVGSCTPTGGNCIANIVGWHYMDTAVQCQTVQVCGWSAYSAWSNVASCSPSTPGCSNGALERQCQTVYSWGDWSAYEEVDVCTPQSPALGAGAVEIECVPQ